MNTDEPDNKMTDTTDPIEVAIEAGFDEMLWAIPCDVVEVREMIRAAIAAYRDAEIEALRGQVAEKDMLLSIFEGTLQVAKSHLADCRAFIRKRGHGTYCPTAICEKCSRSEKDSYHQTAYDPNDWCLFEPAGPCSCGYSRCVEGG